MKNTEPRDFSTPRRMGWEALIVIIVNSFGTLLKNLWILILPLVFGNGVKNGDAMLYFFCGFLVLSFFNPLSRYFTTKIQVKDGKIITTSGLFYKRTKTIPLNRIHALRTKSGPIYQAVDMVGVVFDTIAEKGAELEFILSEADWQMMLGLVSSDDMNEEVVKQLEARANRERNKVVYRMSPLQIVKGTLVQNHFKGLWMIVLALWYVFSQLSDYQWILEKVIAYTEAQLIGASIVFYIATFVTAYIAGLILLFAGMLLKYWGLQITFHQNRLEYEAGLLTRKTVRIRRDKVVGLAIKQNYLERRLGFMSFTFEQASNALDEKGAGELSIIGMEQPQMILDWWYGKQEEVPTEIILKGHSQFGLFWRNLFSNSIYFIVVIVLALVSYLPLLFALLLLIPIFGAESWLRFRKSRIELYDDRIVVHNGFFANRTLLIPMDRIERVERRQLYLFGKPLRAGHLIIKSRGKDVLVRSLRLSTLAQTYDYLLFRATFK